MGLRQADLAKTVGISPSYLNLIEHNRRRIAGKLLSQIASVLKVDGGQLVQGAAPDLLDRMRRAATSIASSAELDRADELAARFPGWAALIAEQGRRVEQLEQQTRALRDRLTHDPVLSEALHDVISSVTSIRATASILTGEEKLDADWLSRFHKNIHGDAVKLADNSEALIRYLEAPEETVASHSPLDSASTWLQAHDFFVEAIERGERTASEVASMADLAPAAQTILSAYLTRYAADATALPFDAFHTAAAEYDFDPFRLATHFNAPFDRVLRRFASLPAGDGNPAFGLAICDGAGALSTVKEVPGFAMARGAQSCPLWPIYTVIGQPGRPLRSDVTLPGDTATRLRCFATAVSTSSGYDLPPHIEATMLVLPDPPETQGGVLPIGPGCRICVRENCIARREPIGVGETV